MRNSVEEVTNCVYQPCRFSCPQQPGYAAVPVIPGTCRAGHRTVGLRPLAPSAEWSNPIGVAESQELYQSPSSHLPL